MLLQIKVYLIGFLYLFGALFMLLFPPRNFKLSGLKYRTGLRNQGSHRQYPNYTTYEQLLDVAKTVDKEETTTARVKYLMPKTAENRSIVVFELHSDGQSQKPGILIIGGINAMAWGGPNAIMELGDKLLHDTNYQTPFFNDYDWYLIPMVNPDGIHFTKKKNDLRAVDVDQWSRNRSIQLEYRPQYWHKNVDRDDTDTCFGTNINRNFAYHWQDDVHKTPTRCSQYYPGHVPFSSAEAKALRDYFHEVGDRISLAIHLHASFVHKKEYILYPWRYSLRQQSNYQTLQNIGEYAARLCRMPDGRLYQVHQGSSDARVAGSLSDYLSGVVGTELVYIVKPYFPPFPNANDTSILGEYVNKSILAITSLVRGERSSTKQNTLHFFGREIEF